MVHGYMFSTYFFLFYNFLEQKLITVAKLKPKKKNKTKTKLNNLKTLRSAILQKPRRITNCLLSLSATTTKITMKKSKTNRIVSMTWNAFKMTQEFCHDIHSSDNIPHENYV